METERRQEHFAVFLLFVSVHAKKSNGRANRKKTRGSKVNVSCWRYTSESTYVARPHTKKRKNDEETEGQSRAYVCLEEERLG